MISRLRRRTSRMRAALGLACALAVVGLAAPARADLLVLDTCVQRCSDDDLLAIATVRRTMHDLRREGLVSTVKGVTERLGGNAPRSTAPTVTAAVLTKHLKDGIQAWIDAHIAVPREYEAAAEKLGAALAEAEANPLIVVSDTTLRQFIPRAYVGRAVSLMRLNRVSEAKQAIENLVRMTPESSILDSWGSEAEKVFQLARKELVARGTGSLTVQVDDPTVLFYLNASGQPQHGVFAGDVLPGVYRVFMQDAIGRSRLFHIEVPARGQATLNVAWHQALQFDIAEPRAGFTFESEAERRLEREYARRVAGLLHYNVIVVIGRVQWQGKDALVGTVYQVSSPTTYRVGVARADVSGSLADAAADLTRFLFSAKGTAAPNVVDLPAPPWELPPQAAAPAPKPRSLGPILVIGGAAVIAAGATWYAFDDQNQTPAAAVGLVGLGAVGVGMWVWLRPDSSTAPAVAVNKFGIVVLWAARF